MVPVWLVGKFTTHFRTDFSGWDFHWGLTGVLTHGHVSEGSNESTKVSNPGGACSDSFSSNFIAGRKGSVFMKDRAEVVWVRGGLLAAFGGKLIDPLVVEDSFLRGSPIFLQKVAKIPRWLGMGQNETTRNRTAG